LIYCSIKKADRSLLLSSLCAPFEKKDFVGLDLESKNNKRRADGRLKKQLGDLSLQAGLPSEAISNYQAASEILRSVNDWLWLGGKNFFVILRFYTAQNRNTKN